MAEITERQKFWNPLSREIKFRFRITPSTIISSAAIIRTMTDYAYTVQSDWLDFKYRELYQRTYDRTMVATGDLRSKLFYHRYAHGAGYLQFICGYLPTANNQSVSQEFDIDKRVHRSVKQHWSMDGETPRCSTEPVNLFEQYGLYKANRAARRRALASSIEETFGVSIRYAAIRNGNYEYEPDMTPLSMKLSALAGAFLRG